MKPPFPKLSVSSVTPISKKKNVHRSTFWKICWTEVVQRQKQNWVTLHLKCLDESQLHPRKLTWNLKMMVFNRNLLFQGFIFRFHVSFRGCNYQKKPKSFNIQFPQISWFPLIHDPPTNLCRKGFSWKSTKTWACNQRLPQAPSAPLQRGDWIQKSQR